MKKSQLFQNIPEKKYVIDVIRHITKYDKMMRKHILDIYEFKKQYMFGYIQEFKDYITPFYYNAKTHYPLNMNTYRGFVTVLRQLCKLLDIQYTYKIKYIYSKYNIIYFFEIPCDSDIESDDMSQSQDKNQDSTV